MVQRSIWMVVLLLLSAAGIATASDGLPAHRGVSWSAPDDVNEAADALLAMREKGVTAVYTTVIEDDRLFTLADSLGIAFYQQVPISRAAAPSVKDQVAALLHDGLSSIIERSRRHDSARYLGLAFNVDTGDRRTCEALADLAEQLRAEDVDGMRLFYTTVLTGSDRCGALVDFVLLDARATSASRRLSAWHSAHQVPAAVMAGAPRPPLQDKTKAEETQAYRLDEELDQVRQHVTEAVFVHTWSGVDAMSPFDEPRIDRRGISYALTNEGATPALEVLQGYFTEDQTVFAFAPPRADREVIPAWFVIAVWVLVALLGALYASVLPFRQLVARYFFTPRFFRDSVQEGRELGVDVYLPAALLLSSAAGLLGAGLLLYVGPSYATTVVVGWLPEGVRPWVEAAVQEPWLLAITVALGALLCAFFWAAVIAILSRQSAGPRLGQALTLVVWPRWPVFLLLVMAAVLLTLSSPLALWTGVVVVSLWTLGWPLRTARTLRHVLKMQVPASRKPLLMYLLSPFVPMLVAAVLLLIYRAELRFIWRLLQDAPGL